MTSPIRVALATLAVGVLLAAPVVAQQSVPDSLAPDAQSVPGDAVKPNADAKACGLRLELFIRSVLARFDGAAPSSDAERRALEAFKVASAKARDMVRSACTEEKSAAAMKKLEAVQDQMETALETLLPAIQDLYASLSDEQKSQLKAFGEQLQDWVKEWSALNLDSFLRTIPDPRSGIDPFRMCFADFCFSFRDGAAGDRRVPDDRRREHPRTDQEEIL